MDEEKECVGAKKVLRRVNGLLLYSYKAFIRKNYLSAVGGTDRPDILTFYPSIAPTFQWGKVPPEADLPFWRAFYRVAQTHGK